MPTRSNALGRYPGLAPELQDTLRRNGMQARLVQSGDGVLLAVQGHDSPLLTYPLSREHLSALTDGGTNSTNRKAYDAFAAVVGKDFDMPKDYVHARNAGGRVTMGLHGYRIGEGEYGRVASPFMDLWARRSMLGWTPRSQEGFHLRRVGGELRYGGAPLVPDRPDGRMKPGELQNGGYGFYYKGNQAAQAQAPARSGEDVLTELRTVVPEIQARPASGEKAKPLEALRLAYSWIRSLAMSLILDFAPAFRVCQALEPSLLMRGASPSLLRNRDILCREWTETKTTSPSLYINFTTSCTRPLSSRIRTSPPNTPTPWSICTT